MKRKILTGLLMISCIMCLAGCSGGGSGSGSGAGYGNGSDSNNDNSTTSSHKSGVNSEMADGDVDYAEYVEDANFSDLYFVEDVKNACPNTVMDEYSTDIGGYACTAVKISKNDAFYQNCTFYVFDSREEALSAFDYLREVWYVTSEELAEDNNLEVLGVKASSDEVEVILYSQLNNNMIITHNDAVINHVTPTEVINEDGEVQYSADIVPITDPEEMNIKNSELHETIRNNW